MSPGGGISQGQEVESKAQRLRGIVKALIFLVVRGESWNTKEGWALKNWCFWIVVLEETLESPLDSKEIKPVNPKGNQLWIFIGGTDAEAEAQVLWSANGKSRLIGKDHDIGKDWGQEKGVTEHEMVRWHHWLSGHYFEQTAGDTEGQGSLVCCSPQGDKESDMT